MKISDGPGKGTFIRQTFPPNKVPFFIALLSLFHICPGCHTIHSWISSSSIPVFFIIATICSLSERSAHQDRPQPAEIARGTGMILPGISCSLHAFSIAMASAVVWKVTTSLSSFFFISYSSSCASSLTARIAVCTSSSVL